MNDRLIPSGEYDQVTIDAIAEWVDLTLKKFMSDIGESPGAQPSAIILGAVIESLRNGAWETARTKYLEHYRKFS